MRSSRKHGKKQGDVFTSSLRIQTTHGNGAWKPRV